MANELRRRDDYKSGTILDNPLAFDATTFTSDELVGLREISGDEHMTMTFDPTGAENGPETIWITAHTAAADTATIERGMEGTSAVEHSQDTLWSAGAGFSDFVMQCLDADRPSGGGLPFTGQVIDVHDKGRFERWDGTAWSRLWAYEAAGRTGATLRVPVGAEQPFAPVTPTFFQWATSDFDPDGFQTAANTLTVPAGCGGLYACSVATHHLDLLPDTVTEFLSLIAAGLDTGIWQSGPMYAGFGRYMTVSFAAVGLAEGQTLKAQYIHNHVFNVFLDARIDLYRIGG